MNHPAAASIPVQREGRRHRSRAIASIAASIGSVVPVDTVISSGGKASHASAARNPASSASGGRRARDPAVARYSAHAVPSAAATAAASAMSTGSQTPLTGATNASGVYSA